MKNPPFKQTHIFGLSADEQIRINALKDLATVEAAEESIQASIAVHADLVASGMDLDVSRLVVLALLRLSDGAEVIPGLDDELLETVAMLLPEDYSPGDGLTRALEERRSKAAS